MQRLMTHVANGLLHFGWAVTGQECADGCVWPRFNGLARLMAGISNKLYGMPWSDDDFTDQDRRIWWVAVENPHLLGRVTGWIYDRCHRAALYLDDKHNGQLI